MPYVLSSLYFLYTAVILVPSNVLFMFCFLRDVTWTNVFCIHKYTNVTEKYFLSIVGAVSTV
jgi:hypothetical protein